MPVRARLALPSLCLAVLACSSAEPSADAELVSRLDRIDQRLAAVESSVKSVADWTEAQRAREAKEEAERKARVAELEARRAQVEAEREAAQAERAEHRESLRALLGHDPREPLADFDVPPSRSREIEGATEGIVCTEPSETRIECSIDRAFLDFALSHPEQMTRQARIVPKQADGKVLGYKLYGIRTGSIPKLLGFKNGDMITRVDGRRIGDMTSAMDAYAKLRHVEHFVLEIERKGELRELEVEIVK